MCNPDCQQGDPAEDRKFFLGVRSRSYADTATLKGEPEVIELDAVRMVFQLYASSLMNFLTKSEGQHDCLHRMLQTNLA